MSPESVGQLAQFLAANYHRGEKVRSFDLRRMSRVLELEPDDMVVTLETGITLAALQKALGSYQQWLPIDPPNPERTSIHEILTSDLSGPRRFGYGTIREHLVGMKVVLADGRLIKSGGKVVKNVAGYDLAKLFIGSRDSLGIVVEATFKVRPMPAAEAFVCAEVELSQAHQVLDAVRDSEMLPTVLDMHRGLEPAKVCIVLGLAGTQAEVDWQLARARGLGFIQQGSLDYERAFWNDSAPVNRISVLPSRVAEKVMELGNAPFVARAGNGVIYFRGVKPPLNKMPVPLMQRVKAAFDPKNILPEFAS